jgi:hypothetical protein
MGKHDYSMGSIGNGAGRFGVSQENIITAYGDQISETSGGATWPRGGFSFGAGFGDIVQGPNSASIAAGTATRSEINNVLTSGSFGFGASVGWGFQQSWNGSGTAVSWGASLPHIDVGGSYGQLSGNNLCGN